MYMELKRALKNRYMAGAILAAFLILGRAYIEFWPGIKKSDVLYIITLPMALSGFTPFAALFPVIPFALSFSEEYNSGYFRLALIRQNRKRYINKKIIATALSGGILMLIVFGMIFFIALIIGTPVHIHEMSGFYEEGIWENIVGIWGGKLVLFLKILLAFLFGAVWSTVCLMISTIFCNQYVAFMGTFIVYQVLWQVLPGSVLNPVYLLRGDNSNYSSVWMPFVIQAGYLIVVMAISQLFMERRLLDV